MQHPAMLSPAPMTIKENLPGQGLHALSGFSVLALSGTDAETFAQAQLMNDLRALAPGQWQWNGWLTAKGRVVALFALLRLAPGELRLLLPDYPADTLADALKRYVFRAKVRIEPAAMTVAGDFNVAPVATPDRALEQAQGALVLDWGSPSQPRSLWLLPAGHPGAPPPDAALDARWREFDIAHGLPRLDADQVEAWTPQMLSLQRLAAYSVKKGCYPGQEIVARTHFLGQAKRALARLAGDGLAAGQGIRANNQAIGSVICASSDGREALAVLAEGDAALDNGLQPCRRVELLEGLRRGP